MKAVVFWFGGYLVRDLGRGIHPIVTIIAYIGVCKYLLFVEARTYRL